MGVIKSVKCTALGNSFVIIDELDEVLIDEGAKPGFARLCNDVHFGLGGDGVLFVQNAHPSVYREINHRWEYWDATAWSLVQRLDQHGIDAIMRIFMPDGSEACMCGNGIRCVAHYLQQKLGQDDLRILTEVPTSTPRVKTVGKSVRPGYYRVNLGPLVEPPPQFLGEAVRRNSVAENARIKLLRNYPLYMQDERLGLDGLIAYPGELHMVLFCGHTSPRYVSHAEGIRKSFYHRVLRQFFSLDQAEQASILNQVGLLFSIGADRELFPSGVCVNFAQVDPTKHVIHYRVFERGVRRETLACGTGAAAVAAVAYYLGLVKSRRISVKPVKAILAQEQLIGTVKHDALVLENVDDEWWLEGPAQEVYRAELPGDAILRETTG
jgi:diaminopimelate epimerase